MTEKIDIGEVRHPGEIVSAIILLTLSIVTFALLVVSVFGLIWFAVFILLELLFHRLVMAFFKANSIQVTENQYPGIHQMARLYSEKLGLKKIPDVYIIQQTTLNAFATRVARRNVVVMYSHAVETMMEGEDTGALGMILAHEMGHFAANHLWWGAVLGGASIFLPPLYLYWSRCCEYTADRLAYLCLEDRSGAFEGLVKMTVGKKMAPATNFEALTQQHAAIRRDIFVKLSEYWSTHPHLLNRIQGLRRFAAGAAGPVAEPGVKEVSL